MQMWCTTKPDVDTHSFSFLFSKVQAVNGDAAITDETKTYDFACPKNDSETECDCHIYLLEAA